MGKSLVIVESPAKAKTINKYLGKEFIVKSSIGHIRDLPTNGSKKSSVDAKARAVEAAKTRKMPTDEKALYRKKRSKQLLVARMGVNPEKNWEANYEILPGKEKVVYELKKQAKTAEFIYLATDLDREGEAIAWHLMETIGGETSRYRRVIFNEITKNAIQKAFETPSTLNLNRVYSQQARRFLDRVVGYMISPLLWAKVARGLSAGRVQSVAVRIIVERERKIRSFIPVEYWELFSLLKNKGHEKIKFQVTRFQAKKFLPKNQKEINNHIDALKKAKYLVTKREDKPTRTYPSPPFITSTLQQAASTKLNFSLKKTMMLAQRLYEAGYITYMRTDSTNISRDAIERCRAVIKKEFKDDRYLPDSPNFYSSKKGAQEAHEAIRPSNPEIKSVYIAGQEDASRLYQLIWKRFVACQMTPAEYTSTSIVVMASDYEMRAKGRTLVFDGHTRVLPPVSKNEEDTILPKVEVNEELKLGELNPFQHFTKPLPRFSEASLVKELEKMSIGRPSTYAAIISTIQERGYVELRNRRFYAKKMGDIVTDRLMENFENLMNYDFTAEMEQSLDKIASGEKKWLTLLDDFYKDLTTKIERAQSESNGMRKNDPTSIDILCSKCGRSMQIRTGSTGVFLGCSGYNLSPKERCKSTINLIVGDEVVNTEDEESESKILINKHHCPKCETTMDSYLIDKKRKIHICGNNPDCPGFEIEVGEYRIKGYEGPIIECDKCSSDMQLKVGRFGKYFGCTNEECKNTRKLLRSGQAAPPKMDPIPMPELKCEKVNDTYLLRDGASGLFLAASQFPKHREIRTPFVDEIIPVKKQLVEKHQYVTTAPIEDKEGNRAKLKFSRKEGRHYVITEKNGKATGWKAVYEKNEWVIQKEKESSKKTKKLRRKKIR